MTVVLDQPAPAPASTVPAAPRLRPVRYEPDPGRASVPAPAARAPAASWPQRHEPDGAALRRQVGWILQLALEAVDGRRPLAHLTPHLDPSALRYLRAACPLRTPADPHGGSRVLSLHVDRPRSDAAEVAATCRLRGRPRAVAARFERRAAPGGQWRCTVLRIG